MIKVTIDDAAVKKMLRDMPATASRAAEHALDQTAWAIYREIGAEINRVFDRPAPYTKRSLKVTKTRNHNMVASVWFKEPDRMVAHYLLPQVEGTVRELKGFERALYRNKFIPSRTLKLDRYGNVSVGLLKQILSVLGRAELTPGYQANTTTKSTKRNKKDRDFVWLPAGSRRGKLPPGVYRRVVRGQSLSSKQRRKQTAFGTYQQGKRKAVVRASGLQPVLISGKQRARTKPRLKFYDIASRVYRLRFNTLFFAKFNALVGRILGLSLRLSPGRLPMPFDRGRARLLGWLLLACRATSS